MKCKLFCRCNCLTECSFCVMQTQVEGEYDQAAQHSAVPATVQAERNAEDQECRIAYPNPPEHNAMIAARNRRRAADDAALVALQQAGLLTI